MTKNGKQGGRKSSPRRIKRYGKLVRGWDWRTDPELLERAEKSRIRLNATRTQYIEQAILLMIEKTND